MEKIEENPLSASPPVDEAPSMITSTNSVQTQRGTLASTTRAATTEVCGTSMFIESAASPKNAATIVIGNTMMAEISRERLMTL